MMRIPSHRQVHVWAIQVYKRVAIVAAWMIWVRTLLVHNNNSLWFDQYVTML